MPTTRRFALLPLFTLVGVMACSGNDTGGSQQGGSGGTAATGGEQSNGGATAAGGSASTGGAPATGGVPATGGTSATGGSPTSGGTKATGGTYASGGATATGGSTANGGTTAKGGSSASGGATGGISASGGATGGTSASGGATGGTSASGGATDTGGSSANGGATDTGGSTVSGDASATGASVSTGGATGGTGGTSLAGGSSGSGGKTGSGGIGATDGGATGGAAGAGGAPPPATGIPAGYPSPTTDNYAKCQKVAVGTTACAGQDTGDVCIECLFGGTDYNNNLTPAADGTSEAGNYLVTVELGGGAGQTYISAESERGLLAPVTTTAGQSLTYAFVVNVRAMEGQPDHNGGPGGYPGLDLFFSGPAATPPQVTAIGYTLSTAATGAAKPIMIYIASDSTACDQTGGSYGGWGQMLPEYFAPPVGIANYANSGASSADYMGNAGWKGITSNWLPGDYLIIQFGHNDKNTADSVVQANLTKFVNAAQAAKVNPILVSPPARVGSIPIGDQTGTSGLHAAAAQAAAAAATPPAPFIDLTALSTAWYNGLGMTKTQVLQAYHALGTDGTHTNLAGAEKIAGLVAGEIKKQNLTLAQYLR